MRKDIRCLVIDDPSSKVKLVESIFKIEDLYIHWASSLSQGIHHLTKEVLDIIILDRKLS